MASISKLAKLEAYAQTGRFPEMLAACQQILATDGVDAITLLDIGVLLFNFGFFSKAGECYTRARNLAPDDPRPLANLANLAREAGDHAESRRIYAALQERLPDHPVLRRNALVSFPTPRAGQAFAKKQGLPRPSTCAYALLVPHCFRRR